MINKDQCQTVDPHRTVDASILIRNTDVRKTKTEFLFVLVFIWLYIKNPGYNVV